jgi:hypothetical protein
MAMITLVCPKCGGVAKLSLVDTGYTGPRRCWKCHEYFTITIENNRLISCEPLSKEEFERQQEAQKAAEKARSGINFSKREEAGISQLTFESQLEVQKTPEKAQSGISFSKKEEHGISQLNPENRQESEKAPEKAQSGISFSKQAEPGIRKAAPESKQDFIRPSLPKEPSLPSESGRRTGTFPPDKIQTFIPVHDIINEPERPKKLKKPSDQKEPGGPSATFPPERFRTFVPIEDPDKKPE